MLCLCIYLANIYVAESEWPKRLEVDYILPNIGDSDSRPIVGVVALAHTAAEILLDDNLVSATFRDHIDGQAIGHRLLR